MCNLMSSNYRPKETEKIFSAEMTRIAIVDPQKCKPTKCRQECRKSCPVVSMGKECITVTPKDKIAEISESLCNGCNICVKKCPFGAITIINVPDNLDKETIHRYSQNSFKLHRLPLPRAGEILGLVGINGIGKSTCLKILAGKEIPNLGQYDTSPTWEAVLDFYKGTDLQTYFTRLRNHDLKAIIKPQYVDALPKVVKGQVGSLLTAKNSLPSTEFDRLLSVFDLTKVWTRQIEDLSGGELQRLALTMASIQKSDMLMLDEPSSYLDIKQRIKMAQGVRSLMTDNKYLVVVEHDLSILDYLSDSVCVLYGEPGKYGVVTLPMSVKEGINVFLDGFIPSENLRFRVLPLKFNRAGELEEEKPTLAYAFPYPAMKLTQGDFSLQVQAGEFYPSEITVMLGENGIGKTSFIRLLAGVLKPDEGSDVPVMSISYKPQKISPSSDLTVRNLLFKKIREAMTDSQFKTDIIKTLDIDDLFDREVKQLSGGELQRVAITLCLGTPADVYLIDEPSAYLDSEQRVNVARVLKRFIRNTQKTAFVVEHDFIMATYLADQVIVFEGTPSVTGVATSPVPLLPGMNKFLKSLDVTFRRDQQSYRPRINKLNSVKDAEQKKSGHFFTED